MARKKKSKRKKSRSRGAARRSPSALPVELDDLEMMASLARLLDEAPPGAAETLLDGLGRAFAASNPPGRPGSPAALDELLGALALADDEAPPDLIDLERLRRLPGFEDLPDMLALDDDELEEEELALGPGQPDRCSPPIRLRLGGGVGQDPCGVLGVQPSASAEDVRVAFRQILASTGAEQAPDIAVQLNEARSLLLAPDRVVERLVGEVSVPDPDAWGLDRGAPRASEVSAMSSPARMAAQLLLYASVEEELLQEAGAGFKAAQQPLFG